MGIGLALSGGGAKGLAHIGVLEALKDYNIPIDYIAGTSSGSIIAALYAAGYEPNEILRLVHENKDKIVDVDKGVGFKIFKSLLKGKISIKGFVKGNNLEKILKKALKEKDVTDINDVKKPLAIPIVNLTTGEVIYYWKKTTTRNEIIDDNNDYDDIASYRESGNLAEIIRASCSVPGVFVPKEIEDELYVDGGVRVNTPVEVLRKMGAEKVIAITFNCNKKTNFGIENIIGISSQAYNIMAHSSNMEEVYNADVNVRLCLNNTSLLDFSNPTYLAKRGYNIIAANIQTIKEKLGIES